MLIKHLQHEQIDYQKWDQCIMNSKNRFIYAETWFLDSVSPSWEALVANNYEYVMPLPVKTKYGIPYLVQPILTQQLGVFSPSTIDEQIVAEFIKKIPYPSYELNLNENNYFRTAPAFPNYILELNQSYEEIRAKFSKNTRRNIEKAKKHKLRIIENLEQEIFVDFYYLQEKKFTLPDRTLLEAFLKRGIAEEKIKILGVFSLKNELIAALCLLHSGNRYTYLIPVSNTEGKKSSAMFLLIDEMIRKNANQKIILDFEGSRIEGIARFYKGFGAKNRPYYVLKKFRPSFLVGKI
jgi:lipid II:glycine glycyltransferase (peptidoglycan interpeptide bridge formation enzyme)